LAPQHQFGQRSRCAQRRDSKIPLRQRADIGPLELDIPRERDGDGASSDKTAFETGKNLIERTKAAGKQAMWVAILRRAGARCGGCRQPVALQNIDLFEVSGQGAGGRQAADPGSNDDGARTQLMRTIRPLLSRRQCVFDQLCHFPLLRMQSRTFNRVRAVRFGEKQAAVREDFCRFARGPEIGYWKGATGAVGP